MKNSVFFIYLLILVGSTYLIRVIPFIAIKEKISNSFVRSFLYYIPYAVLTAMTIPAVFYATNWWVGAAAGLIAAVIFALKGKGLTTVAVAATAKSTVSKSNCASRLNKNVYPCANNFYSPFRWLYRRTVILCGKP